MDKDQETRDKALKRYLSGKQISGRGTEIDQSELSEEEIESLKGLPTSTKDMKIRGRKKGTVTPRQTIRIDESLWKAFQAACRRKEGKSASEIVRRFIQGYVGGK